MGIGEFLSLACALCWASAVIIFRSMGESLPAFSLNLFKNTLMAVLMVPTIALFAGGGVPELSPAQWAVTLGSGVIGIAIADTLFLRTLQMIGASRTAVTGSLFSPFVITLSLLFLGERITWLQLSGIPLILLGVVLVSWHRERKDVEASTLRRGIAIGVLAQLAMASGIVMMKPLLETESFFWLVELRMLGGLLAMAALMSWRRQWREVFDGFRQPHVNWWKLSIASFLATYAAMLLWLGGYKYTQASVASVLNESASIWIALLAWWFLDERMHLRRISGIALAVCGVVVMALGG